MSDDDKPTVPGSPIELSRWQRGGAALFGAALMGAGAWADIFSGRDGAGTVALVAAGAVLGGLGVIGRLPSRLSGKDYTLEFDQRVEKIAQEKARISVDAAIDELPRSAREELASTEIIFHTSEPDVAWSELARYIAASAEKSLQLEEVVEKNLREAAQSEGVSINKEWQNGPLRFDYALEIRGYAVPIEVKRGDFSGVQAKNIASSIYARAKTYNERIGAVIVVSENVTVIYRPDMEYVRYSYPNTELLSAAIARAKSLIGA